MSVKIHALERLDEDMKDVLLSVTENSLSKKTKMVSKEAGGHEQDQAYLIK